MTRSILTILSLLSLFGCAQKEASPARNTDSRDHITPGPHGHKPESKQTLPRSTLKLDVNAGQKAATAINRIGDALLRALAASRDKGKSTVALTTHDRNVVISSYSVASALALAWAGARHETEREFEKLFSMELPKATQHATLGALQYDLEQVSSLKLNIANSLWLEKSMPIRPAYLTVTRKWYNTAPFSVDFLHHAGAVTARINSWVSQKTNDRIKDLIPSGMLSKETRAVLVNAIWFLARWRTPFTKTGSAKRPFFPGPGYETRVMTMAQKNTLPMTTTPAGATLVSLPYKGGRFTFVIYMPKEGAPLTLPGETTLSKEIAALKPVTARYYIPKFTLEDTSFLAERLKSMGMKRSFAAGADFSGITTAPGGIFLNKVIHKTFIKVDEEGTEAAAATAIVALTGAAAPRPVPVVAINRPFYFFVRDTKTGLNLFTGRIVNPDPKATVSKRTTK